MKAQVTSILLCALLASTLGHEYLSAKRLSAEARSNYRSPLAQFQDRAAPSNEICEWICEPGPVNPGGGLQIIVNETTNLVGIVNVTAKVALIIDVNANLVGLFNGSTGAIIILNIKTGAGIYIAADQSNAGWISSNQSFELFFRGLISLQVIVNLNVGTKFTATSVSNDILEIIVSLLVTLSWRIGQQVSGNLKLVISILVQITGSIVTNLQGSLKGLLKLLGGGLISVYGDLLWLVDVFEGLGILISKVTGGLAALIKADIDFKFALLLKAANGVELLVNILLSIVAVTDLSILAGVLNSVEVLLLVIVKLGGGVSTGVTGIFKIISQIINVTKDSTKIDILIATLIEFSVESSGGVDLSVSLEGLLKVIEIQKSLYAAASISVFIAFVENIQKGQLEIGGVNISKIITVLVKGVVGGVIDLVVSVLLLLTGVIQVVLSIPSLLLYLLGLLNSSAGVQLLRRIIPGLSISVSVNGEANIIAEVFRGINIQTILKLILSGFNVKTVLTSIPVLGQIFTAVSKSVSAASSGSLDLDVILKSSGAVSIVQKIQVWIKSAISISQSGGGGVAVTASAVSSTTAKSGGSYTWSWSWSSGQGKSAHLDHEKQKERHHEQHH